MKILFSIILFFIINISSYSHPHVFFETEIALKIENKKLEGIEVKLNLDELNTRLNKRILKPSSKDASVDEKNIVFLKHLFKHIRINFNGRNYSQEDIYFEQAFLEDDSLEIYFFIPIEKNIDKNSKLKMAFYDTNYYYNYEYDESSIKIDKDSKSKDIKVKVNFFENKKIKFYFRLVSPQEYEVSFE